MKIQKGYGLPAPAAAPMRMGSVFTGEEFNDHHSQAYVRMNRIFICIIFLEVKTYIIFS